MYQWWCWPQRRDITDKSGQYVLTMNFKNRKNRKEKRKKKGVLERNVWLYWETMNLEGKDGEGQCTFSVVVESSYPTILWPLLFPLIFLFIIIIIIYYYYYYPLALLFWILELNFMGAISSAASVQPWTKFGYIYKYIYIFHFYCLF